MTTDVPPTAMLGFDTLIQVATDGGSTGVLRTHARLVRSDVLVDRDAEPQVTFVVHLLVLPQLGTVVMWLVVSGLACQPVACPPMTFGSPVTVTSDGGDGP